MRKIRIYHPQEIKIESTIELTSVAAHHICNVLRLKIGQQLFIFNGDGYDYRAILNNNRRRDCQVTIIERQLVAAESKISIDLYCGLIKGAAQDKIIQQAVELGVMRIQWLNCARSNLDYDARQLPKKMAHWQNIICAAAMQTQRARLPLLNEPIEFKEAIENACGERWIFLPHQQTSNNGQIAPQQLSLLVGPEGGFTEQEIDLAKQNNWQQQSLGRRILRADTAIIAAIIKAQLFYGEF